MHDTHFFQKEKSTTTRELFTFFVSHITNINIIIGLGVIFALLLPTKINI